MTRRPSALPPIALVAVALLVVNDHYLKQAFPGFVTGKLSDVAGMVFFPLLLRALLRPLLPARLRESAGDDRLLLACCLATAVAFALTKTTELGNQAYRVAWAALQWPFWALRALVRGRPMPGLRLVGAVKDPTDLLAVPFVTVAYVAGRARRA